LSIRRSGSGAAPRGIGLAATRARVRSSSMFSLEAWIVFLIVIVVYRSRTTSSNRRSSARLKISGFTVLASVPAFGARFGLIGAIIGVPIAAALQIVVEELTAGRRARIATADAAERTR
jgi:predicted PurR-regulated permease PerM